MTITQMGTGDAGHFLSINPTNGGSTVRADQFGLGHAGDFESFDVNNTIATVEAQNNGNGDGIHGIAVDSACTTSGVTGTGRYDAANAAALNAHDGAIRVSKTHSPDTPADFIDINLTSWLPMEDCAAACSPIGASNVYAYNSDVILIPNVYADPARSVIIHTVEQTDPSMSPLLFVRALIRTVVPGGFSVQFILDMNQCTGLCSPPGVPVRLHYLIINK